jgi:uncharacterized protein
MQGIDATSGKRLDGIAHLRQSIRDILTTPKGSRVMRREYGSDLYKLIDAPVNSTTLMDIRAATADALKKWEPRFKLEQCKILAAEPGRVELDLVGIYLPDGKEITLDGIEIK